MRMVEGMKGKYSIARFPNIVSRGGGGGASFHNTVYRVQGQSRSDTGGVGGGEWSSPQSA